jgi:hypothetical protein
MKDDTTFSLVKYEAARSALAEARSVDEVLDVRDRAARIHFYARQAKDREMIDAATELRLRAERRLGEMIAEQKETVGLNRGAAAGGKKHSSRGSFTEPRDTRPTLAEAGIDKKLSARAQQLSALPDDQFALRLSPAKREAIAHIEMPLAARAAEKKRRRAEREVERGAKIAALPSKRFGVILADPPWKFGVWSPDTSNALPDYPTCELETIKALDAAAIAADDCALFLWATVPMLIEALAVMEAWNFAYKSHFVWVKNKIGNGYWNRGKHELLLIGTRGDPPTPRLVWSRGRDNNVAEDSYCNPRTGLLCALETVRHPGLTPDDYPDIIECLALSGAGGEPPSAAMMEMARTWASGWANRLANVRERAGFAHEIPGRGLWERSTPKVPTTPAPQTSRAVHHLTAAEIVRAAQIRRGEFTPLPVDPTARAIIKAGADRRAAERKDTKPL